MPKKKEFECKPYCKKQYISMVILSCPKCIKHIAVDLTEKQIEEITKIVFPYEKTK